MVSPTMVTSVTFVAGLILFMSSQWSLSSLVSAAVTTTRNYDNLSSLTLNDKTGDDDAKDEYFGLGDQMRSQRAFTQLEFSGGQQRMSQGPRGVDDAVKHSTLNKTKRPTPLVPFLNTLQSSSQEINLEYSAEKPEGKDEVDLLATKLPDSYYVEGNSDFTIGTGNGNSGNLPRLIRCVCNTSDCVPRNNNGGNNGTTTTCLTSGMCYTQILDYEDGRPSVSKGCIRGANLLCENRRPKNIRIWPWVKCCSSDLCNSGTFSPRKAQLTSVATAAGVTTSVNHGNVIRESEHDEKLDLEDAGKDPGGRHEKIKPDNHPDNEDAIEVWTNLDLKKNSLDVNGRVSPLISPLASSFLIGGAVVVIVISAIGFYILRKEQR